VPVLVVGADTGVLLVVGAVVVVEAAGVEAVVPVLGAVAVEVELDVGAEVRVEVELVVGVVEAKALLPPIQAASRWAVSRDESLVAST
jgi:hypothetical protein